MKKLFFICGALVLAGSLFAANLDKTAILKKVAAVYNQPQMSVEMGMTVSVMDMSIPMSSKFWIKGNSFRVETIGQLQQGLGSFQTTMISDGTTLWIQNSITPDIMKIDLTKLPDSIRKSFVQSSFMGFDPQTLSQNSNFSDVTETETGNAKYYILTTTDLGAMTNNLPQNMQMMNQKFKKLVLWVDATTSQITRIETYGDAQQPGMDITFSNLSFSPIDGSLFQYTPPAGAQIQDMTNQMFQGVSGGNNPLQQ